MRDLVRTRIRAPGALVRTRTHMRNNSSHFPHLRQNSINNKATILCLHTQVVVYMMYTSIKL